MNSPLESGLFLPIRFYESLDQQDRFKRISEGVSIPNEVYIFVDCKSLAPFQLILAQFSFSLTVTWRIYCIDESIPTELPFNASDWEFYYDNHKHWISYLGTGDLTGYINNGKYYLEVMIRDFDNLDHYYYSDIFIVDNCNELYETTNFRLTSQSTKDKRTIDGTNLRIITKP